MLEFFTRVIEKWPLRIKLGLLVFLVHLDPALSRSYVDLSQRLRCQTSWSANREAELEAGSGNVPKVWSWMKILRFFTNLLHCYNTVKVFILILIFNGKLIPIECNCYLPGRFGIHETLIDYLPVVALYVSVLNVVWRYITQMYSYNFELDLMVYLLCDQQKIDVEIKEANSFMESAHSAHTITKVGPSRSVLSRVLFYKIEGSNSTIYKLRPNRKDKRELKSYLNRMIFCLITIFALTTITVVPGMCLCVLPDPNYIKIYPTCCPELELLSHRGELEYWRVSYHLCGQQRMLAITFDIIDNLFMFVDSALCLFLPLGISMLVTKDLMHYWRSIDLSINDLVRRFKLGETSDGLGNRLASTTSHINRNIVIAYDYDRSPWLRPRLGHTREAQLAGRLHMATDSYEMRIVELQAQLCDFFACLGRQNRFINVLISFSVFLFALFILTIGYLALKIPHLWSTQVIRFIVCLIYAMFFSGSMLLLQLKGAIDGSYVELCTLMAYDRSRYKQRWAQILDNYMHTKRNSFTIFKNVHFNWALVLNLAASSVSFLAVIETYKYQ